MTFVIASLAFVAGAALGWAASRYQVGKTSRMRRDIGFLISRPVDLEPSEFGTFWEARQ
jgi:hypothetical protein